MQTRQSIDFVRKQIQRKNSNSVYMSNGSNVLKTVTDIDTWPYPRNYRGVYYYPDPIVMEREAGYRKVHNNCYEMIVPFEKDKEPVNCFETACSTIYPCLPEIEVGFEENSKLNRKVNDMCIVQYR